MDQETSYILTGVTAGAVLGLVLGVTFWTHAPTLDMVVITVLFVLSCAAVGGWIGKISAGMEAEAEAEAEAEKDL